MMQQLFTFINSFSHMHQLFQSIHPGMFLIVIGLCAAITPARIRRLLLIAGPLFSFFLALIAQTGDQITLPLWNERLLQLSKVTTDNRSFLFVFSLMALMGGIYACHNKNRMEAFSSMAYAGSALGVTLAGDWLTFIFFWELMAVTSLFLIWEAHTEASRKAGFRYLLLHMFGGNLLLFGIFIKVSQGEYLVSTLTGSHDLAFWLILTGIGINAAIVPLHAWVVDAYPEGTITGSVFLSSFTTKLAILCLLRTFAGEQLLIYLGVLMILYGACFALIENNIRRLLSYHIISQLGFMVADVGIGTTLALNAASALAFSNVLYKSLLFMCAGAIISATGIKKINQLGGLARKMPFVCLIFFIAAFSIAGVPGFAGFTCKSISMSAAEHAGLLSVTMLMKLGSLGTALSIPLKMGYFIFFGTDRKLPVKSLPKNMYVAMSIAAFFCILLGVRPQLLYQMLPYTLTYHPYTLSHIIEYVELLSCAFLAFVLYLRKMEPHTALSLDTDWILRKPFPVVLSGICTFCCTVSDFFGTIGKKIYSRFTGLCSATFVDEKKDQTAKRLQIGEGMIGILLTIILVFLLLLIK